MKLRQLICLHEVIGKSFNITAAAKALYTSQSGVSRHLQELADELQVDLFQYRGKRLTGLTPVGEEIAEAAAEIIGIATRIKRIAENQRSGGGGVLSIVANRHAAAGDLQQAILRCREELPSLRFEITQENPANAFALLRADKADLGLLPEPPEEFQDLQYRPLAQWRLLLTVPRGHPLADLHPVTLEALARYPCCCYDRSARSRQIVDQTFAAAGLPSPVAFSLDSSASILDYVESGVGIGLIGETAFDPERHPGLLAIPVAHLFRPLTTGLVLSNKVRVTAAMQTFVRFLAPDLVLEKRDGRFIQHIRLDRPATTTVGRPIVAPSEWAARHPS